MIEDRIQRQVLDMYREVDRAVTAAGPICVASGKCCRFKEYGHTLYLSNLEADVLLSDAPPYEPPVSADFCPFQKENLCTAREPRPLACRIFFCDPSYQETANRLTEEFLHRLKALARENDIEWRYAPLHQFLNHEAHTNPKRERKSAQKE
jgi:Fe-S-cluster containining protein